ncbi:tannase and feruloyl esterase [Saccharata proteae CBS 121410]|uniref:Carboxylic ester hydrolase n=1 Tax=Saccharata proteae CBS 121410 TaxID=1314787 RepID=A0A9P4LYV7_9PEZI|nr:tannase and feruloyl esterase [Saccharata proteae CBS 121410]
MWSVKRSLALAAATAVVGVSAASLSDVCTSDYVASALPTDIEGITIDTDSVTANAVYNYSVPASDLYPGGSGYSFCNMTVSYTRNGAADQNTSLWYWLPAPSEWKGRYLTTGGRGFLITYGQSGLGNGLVYGAVTGTTDGGFGSWDASILDVILKANHTMDYDMLFNFGYRSLHELTLIGKEFSKNFYDSSSLYSYYQGCSEGGREGWSQVQRYGDQFDGAAIGAPAFRLPFQQVIHLFSGIVELTNGYVPPPCELEKIRNDTIDACDELDGRKDGVVARSDLCIMHYNASASVGKSYSCPASNGTSLANNGGSTSASPASNGTVTAAAARIAEDIYNGLWDSDGKQVYVSYPPSASFSDASATYNSTTGEYFVESSSFTTPWVNYFLKKIASNSLSLDNVTYDTLRDWMVEGFQEYSDTLFNTWPDLEGLRASGGKVIHFHGESDSSIPVGSSVIYHDAVRQVMYPDLSVNESYAKLHEFYRLFLVPGAEHCAPSSTQPNGPFPQNVLGSVIEWVENGVNPERLNATVLDGTTGDVEQKICSFPLRPLWRENSTMDCVFDDVSYKSWIPDLSGVPLPIY